MAKNPLLVQGYSSENAQKTEPCLSDTLLPVILLTYGALFFSLWVVSTSFVSNIVYQDMVIIKSRSIYTPLLRSLQSSREIVKQKKILWLPAVPWSEPSDRKARDWISQLFKMLEMLSNWVGGVWWALHLLLSYALFSGSYGFRDLTLFFLRRAHCSPGWPATLCRLDLSWT